MMKKKKNKAYASSSFAYKMRCIWFVNKLNYGETLFLQQCVKKHLQDLSSKVDKLTDK